RARAPPPCGAGFMPADGVSAVAAVQPTSAGRDKPGPTDSSQPQGPAPAPRTPCGGRLYAGRRRVGGRCGPTPPSLAGINPAPQILPSHKDPRPRPAPPVGAGYMPADGVSAVAAVQPRLRWPG